MKILIVVLVLLSQFHSNVMAQDVVVAISPYQQDEKAYIKLIIKFTEFEPGSNIILLDGYRLKKIAEFNIPARKLNPRAIMNRNKRAIKSLKAFYQGEKSATWKNAVRLPQLLRYIGRNYAVTDVVVLGSAIYDDPKEDGNFSMKFWHVPSDGHIRASRAVSPYGTAESSNRLISKRIHLAYHEDDLLNDQHAMFLTRFLTLLIENQGGKLVSFDASEEAVFDRILNKAEPMQHSFSIDSSTKLEMIGFHREKPSIPIYDRKLSDKPLHVRDIQNADDVEIGIRWVGVAVDLDLYALGHPRAEILYFGRPETVMGSFWKDFTSGVSLQNAYETISFHTQINLEQLKLGVNFYGGDAPNGVSGSIRLTVAGQTYELPFSISATRGNQMEGMTEAFRTGKATNQNVVMINPLAIIQGNK